MSKYTIHSLFDTLKAAEEAESGGAVVSIDHEVEHPLSGAQLDGLMDNHFKHMFDVFNDGIFYMSDNEHVCFYSPAFYRRFGINTGHSCLNEWLKLVHPLDREMLDGRVDEHIAQDNLKMTTQYRIRATTGDYVWLEATSITKTINGQRFMVGCHKDISQQKDMEAFLRHTSLFDIPTGLANEQKLTLDLNQLTAPEGEQYHLLNIHVSDLRTYLSLYGSQSMRDVLNHLLISLKTLPDVLVDIYRIRSDDFVILCKGDYTTAALNDLAQRIITQYQDALNEQGVLYGRDMVIGIYPNFPIDAAPDDTLKIAARTCHFALEQGDGAISIYDDKTKDKVDRHFYIERELGEAIQGETLNVKFQPIICTQQNRVASFEALVRWKSREMGEIYPDEFIALAEKKGLVSELGYFVFAKACEFIKAYSQQHQSGVRVNINVSVLQLLQQDFPKKIKAMADHYGVPTSSIVLELTETIILDGNQSAFDQLYRLNGYGFLLSLDDFGSGYSSLNSFFDLPLKQIKVDKSIAWRSLQNPATFEYLAFITKLCKSYSVDIVIEGIESAEMQRIFTDMGASYLQGYWFSKPLSLASASRYTTI